MSEKRRVVKLKDMQVFELGESKSKSAEKEGVRFYILGQKLAENLTAVKDLQYDRNLDLPNSANVYGFDPPKYYDEATGDTVDTQPEGTPKGMKAAASKGPAKDNKGTPPAGTPPPKKTAAKKKETKTPPAKQEKKKKDPYDKDTMTPKQLEKWSKDAEKQEKIIVALKREIDIKFIAMGCSLVNFETKKYYIARGYDSMRAWLGSPEINISKSKANRAMDIVKTLMVGHDYKPEELEGVGEAKLAMITDMIGPETKKKEIDDWIGTARVLSKSDLKKELDKIAGKQVREVSQTYKGTLVIREDKVYLVNKKESIDLNLLQLCKSYGTDEVTATIRVMSKPQ